MEKYKKYEGDFFRTASEKTLKHITLGLLES